MKQILTIAVLICGFFLHSQAQGITLPPSGDNQKASVTQYIGSLVSVTVDYSSPDVTAPNGDDRTGKIWGQLVPYGLTDLGFGLRNPSPWRAGANENTVITFSHDVEVEGKPLPAGSYGLHLIVNETGPWTWIFSKNYTAWGSYFYDAKDDALRVDVTAQENTFTEWLTYDFIDRQKESATLALKWENMMVPMQISVPGAVELYANNMERELQSAPGFTAQNWANAANFLAQNNHNLDLALEWAEAAISAPFVGVVDFNNLQTKATVLMKMGKMEDAQKTMDKAINHPSANSGQIHTYGRTLIGLGMKEKALEVFQMNYDKNDGAWPTTVGMARGLSAVGKFEDALKYAEMALEQAPDQLNKDNLKNVIEKLKAKQDIN
jgi:hypothetical protein